MTVIPFDAITYAKKLAGLDSRIAAVEEEQLSDILGSVVTKSDIQLLEHRLKEFMVICTLTIIGLLGGLQAILYMMHG